MVVLRRGVSGSFNEERVCGGNDEGVSGGSEERS